MNKVFKRIAIILFLFPLCQAVWLTDSYPQGLRNRQAPEFNIDYKVSIGDNVYTIKTDGVKTKKIHAMISGVKKNRDNTIYMLIEFNEEPSPGAPVFYADKIIGMVYRQSTTGNLYEAIPVKVILDFMKDINIPATEVETSKGDKKHEDKISEIRGYIEKRDYDNAIKILQNALEKNAENAELRGWMGIVMMEIGNPNQAAVEFKKAIAIEPANADFYNGLGYAMLATGSFDEAINSFKEAIRINPKHADAHYGIGNAFINIREVKLATKEYIVLKDLNEKMANSLFKLIMRSGGSETE